MAKQVKVLYYDPIGGVGDTYHTIDNFRCIYNLPENISKRLAVKQVPKYVTAVLEKTKKFSGKVMTLDKLVAEADAVGCLVAAGSWTTLFTSHCGAVCAGFNEKRKLTKTIKNMKKKFAFGPIKRI